MTYSIDFRRKVLEIKERDDLSSEKAAARFGVGKSSAGRRAKRPEPCRSRNKPAVKIDTELPAPDAELYPDAYQHERAERSGCSRRGIGEALKRLKISRKKNSSASEGG
ncbi:MAG: transposase [Gammaproteobacteria bacterium]|nr:transposase [Gammaproteobacteria bacterium]